MGGPGRERQECKMGRGWVEGLEGQDEMRGAEVREWEEKWSVKCQLSCLGRARKGEAGGTE